MMKRSKEMAICTRPGMEPAEVRVMARAEGYAMVRRKGAAPFVVSEKQLTAGDATRKPRQ